MNIAIGGQGRLSPFSHHHLQLPPGWGIIDICSLLTAAPELRQALPVRRRSPQILGPELYPHQLPGWAGMGGYGGANSMIVLLRAGQEYEPPSSGPTSNHQHARPTTDLMQMPLAHQVRPHNGPHLHSQVSRVHYNKFHFPAAL